MLGQEELISVIVPVYNVRDYLRRCVDSILCQTYGNWELILIDDGSSDGSCELCDEIKSADKRIRVVHQENAGVSAARNRGIEDSKGEYLAFVDADDWVDNQYLMKLYLAIVSSGADLAAIGYNLEFFGGYKSVQLCSEEELLSAEEVLAQAMDKQVPWVGYVWGKLFRREILIENKLLFDCEVSICEDSLFCYMYIDKVSKVLKLPDCGYHYFIRSDSATRTSGTNYTGLKSKITALGKAKVLADKYTGSEFKSRINEAVFDALMSYLVAMFSHGVYDKAEIIFVEDEIHKLEDEVDINRLPKGISTRYHIFKASPRLLFCLEWFRMHF